MKVLFVNTSDSYGGAAKAAMRIMCGVKSLGVGTQMLVKYKQSDDENVVELNSFTHKNKLYKFSDWCALKIKNKWQHYKWNSYKNKQNVYLSDLRSTSAHGVFKKLNYDILHLNWINQRFIDIGTLKKINKPIVWTLHDSWAFCGVCHYFLNCDKYKTHCGNCMYLHSNCEHDLSYEVFELKKKYFNGLNLHVITPSKWLFECVNESALLNKFPVSVIPNCIDTNLFFKKSKRTATAKWMPTQNNIFEKKYILYGAMNSLTDRIKGFSKLYSALQILEKKYDCSNVEFLVFGDDKHIENCNLKMKVHYMGYIDNDNDLALLYSLADVMVVPSLTEVFGQTASEAMSCGTPVVVFKCTGIQDVVDDSCGYLATPFSSEDLADGIVYCFENNKNGELSRNARKKVMENFSIDVVCKKYVDLYSEII